MKKILCLVAACCTSDAILGVTRVPLLSGFSDEEGARLNQQIEICCDTWGESHWKTIPLYQLPSFLDQASGIYINGSDCQLTGSVLDTVADWRGLTRLFISSESLDDNSMEKLKNLLKKNSSIKELYIEPDHSGGVPNLTIAGLEKLKEGMSVNQSVTTLAMYFPWLKEKSHQNVLESILDDVNCLLVTTKFQQGSTSLEQLKTMKDVESIEIYQVPCNLLQRIIEFLKSENDLNPKKLKFFGKSVNDDNVKYISELFRITPCIDSWEFYSGYLSETGFDELITHIAESQSRWNHLEFEFPKVSSKKCHDAISKITYSRKESDEGVGVLNVGIAERRIDNPRHRGNKSKSVRIAFDFFQPQEAPYAEPHMNETDIYDLDY